MKKLIALFALAIIAACKKDATPNIGFSSCRLQGMPVQSKDIWVKYTYLSNKFNRAEFSFGYNDFIIGDSLHNFNQIAGTSSTDSLITNTTYSTNNGTFYFWNTIANIVISPVFYYNMQLTITNVSGNIVSGTFLGVIKGNSLQTGLLITDSISNGVFTDVPIKRIYE